MKPLFGDLNCPIWFAQAHHFSNRELPLPTPALYSLVWTPPQCYCHSGSWLGVITMSFGHVSPCVCACVRGYTMCLCVFLLHWLCCQGSVVSHGCLKTACCGRHLSLRSIRLLSRKIMNSVMLSAENIYKFKNCRVQYHTAKKILQRRRSTLLFLIDWLKKNIFLYILSLSILLLRNVKRKPEW